jgi:hypothetical protein
MYLDDIRDDLSTNLTNNTSIFNKNEGTVNPTYSISASHASPAPLSVSQALSANSYLLEDSSFV